MGNKLNSACYPIEHYTNSIRHPPLSNNTFGLFVHLLGKETGKEYSRRN